MSLSEYFEQHEEQKFVVKALATAVAIILFREFLSGLLWFLFLIFPLAFLIGIKMHAAASGVEASELLKEHITFFPMMRSEKETRLEGTPWVTYGIIAVNTLVFYGFEIGAPVEVIEELIFLPKHPDLFNVPISAFTAMFLHASNGHLWGNMTFLWVVGTAVERRVGRMKFFLLYLLTGLIGGLVYLLVEFLAHGQAGHALGASGAIAGIMGIFAVRCYFKTMIFPFPILGIFSLIFPVSLKIRLNSLVVMSLFFLSDLSGGIGQITGSSESMVGHWAHLGGMISGMLLAGLYLKLGDAAVQERHLAIGLDASGKKIGFEGGERSLQKVLERTPDNVEALLALARLKTKFSCGDEGKELYEKVLRLMLAEGPGGVPELFGEYRGKYHTVPSDQQTLHTLAEVLRLAGEHDFCIYCLQPLVEMQEVTPEVREKSLFQLATLLESTGCHEAARGCYARFAYDFPQSLLVQKAREKAAGHVYLPPRPKQPVKHSHPPVCPECGTAMSVRTSKGGSNSGKRFWVCGRYPDCRHSFPVDEAGREGVQRSRQPQRLPQKYRLVFDGVLPFTCDPEETKANLALLLRCAPEQVERLVSGKKTVLKRGVDQVTALKMKEAFDRTGACCTIEQEEDPALVITGKRGGGVPAAASASNPAAVPEPSFRCPKCGFEQEKGECCVSCGVYFTKLVMLAERELLNQFPVSR